MRGGRRIAIAHFAWVARCGAAAVRVHVESTLCDLPHSTHHVDMHCIVAGFLETLEATLTSSAAVDKLKTFCEVAMCVIEPEYEDCVEIRESRAVVVVIMMLVVQCRRPAASAAAATCAGASTDRPPSPFWLQPRSRT